MSRRQVEHARRLGFSSIAGDSIPVTGAKSGEWSILETRGGEGSASLEFARSLAQPVCQLLAHAPIDALVVFGGDTANAIVEALGAPPLHLLGEVMEGVPISQIEANRLGPDIGRRKRELYMVTKAGSFGTPELLASIRDSLGQR